MPEEAARRAVSPFRSGLPEESTAGFLHLKAAGFGCHELLQPCSHFPCWTPRGSRRTPRYCAAWSPQQSILTGPILPTATALPWRRFLCHR